MPGVEGGSRRRKYPTNPSGRKPAAPTSYSMVAGDRRSRSMRRRQ